MVKESGEHFSEERTRELISRAEISVVLNSYEDIFSDFDSRELVHREISKDFIAETKKSALEREGVLDLNFLIPKKHKDVETEMITRRRIRDYFRKHALLLEYQMHRTRLNGIFMAIVGVILLLVSSFLFSINGIWLASLLIVIFQPAGWFMVWLGFNEIYYNSREVKSELDFNRRITKGEIVFHTY